MATEEAAAAGDKAQRLILRGGRSAAIGLVIRFGARILFLFVAARLFGALLFGAYSLAVAVVELGVAVGVLGMKRLLFKLLDEDETGRPPAHILLDAAFVVAAVSLAIAAGLMMLVALPPIHALLGETAWPLLLVAPMIAGQALLDLFLAATRWRHRMRYEVVARSIVEPYAATAAAVGAHYAGFAATGLLIGYWAGTLLALGYAILGARRSFGGFGLARYRLPRGRLGALLRASAVPTLSDFASALFTRLDLYLVGVILGEGPTGIYNVARQVRTPIRQVRQSFDGLLTPIIARTLAARGAAETGRAVASAARLILAIQLPILVALATIGLPLLAWFGPEFAIGYWALLLLAGRRDDPGRIRDQRSHLPLPPARRGASDHDDHHRRQPRRRPRLDPVARRRRRRPRRARGDGGRRNHPPHLATRAPWDIYPAPLYRRPGRGRRPGGLGGPARRRLGTRDTGARHRARRRPAGLFGRAEIVAAGDRRFAGAGPLPNRQGGSMKATIYHNPNCTTSRKTLEILREAGADVTVIDYLKTPPSKAELRRLYDRAGLTPRQGLRAKEQLAKDLDLVDGAVSGDAILDAMADNPILIERPLVETEKGVRLCRPQDVVREIL